MELNGRNIFLLNVMLMVLSAADGVKFNLTRVVGGNVTFPDPVEETGTLLYNSKTVAIVLEKKSVTVEDHFQNKLYWNQNSGHFTITNLQKNDSGIYQIDSKKGKIAFKSYDLLVYDSAPSPMVTMLKDSSDSCWLLCSVDKPATLLWFRDEMILKQMISVFSLNISVHRQDRDAVYRCVSANPADKKSSHVSVETVCRFKETQRDENNKTYWVAVVVPVGFIVLVALCTCMIWQKHLRKRSPVRQTQDSVKDMDVLYTPVQICRDQHSQGQNLPESSGTAEKTELTSVYAKLECHHQPPDV